MKKIKRILALCGASLLAVLYLATLVCALLDKTGGMVLFKASILCTILVPVLIWAYTLIYRIAKGKDEKELQQTLDEMEKK